MAVSKNIDTYDYLCTKKRKEEGVRKNKGEKEGKKSLEDLTKMQHSLAQSKRRDKYAFIVNPLSANPIKWSNTLKLYSYIITF